jgi:hypothetical protein
MHVAHTRLISLERAMHYEPLGRAWKCVGGTVVMGPSVTELFPIRGELPKYKKVCFTQLQPHAH